MGQALKRRRDSSLELITSDDGNRYDQGWRAGKPIEDPEKTKKWGFVTAKPSEYLVCVKRGRINRKASGQGARVFKWPWESVAIVPTTLQQVEFMADQITRERTGVRVSGLAVYRITEPEIAFRVLNFSYGERASEKLASTMREMFIGAARRLIANLTLDECLMKRKEAIASFLMQEIAPVVSGRGSPEDSTDRGWGVVIDTIEIQDVKVQSEKVFCDLQAAYRAELATKAAMAELEREREVAEHRAETELKIAQAAIESERQTRLLRAHAEAEAAEREAAETLRAEQAKASVAADELARREALEKRRLEVEQGLALKDAERNAAIERNARAMERERQLAAIAKEEEQRRATAEAERSALTVEAELAEQSHQYQARKLEQERAREVYSLETEAAVRERQLLIEVEERRRRAESTRQEVAVEAARQRALAEVEQMVSQGRVMADLVSKGLPSIADAFRHSFGTVNYTQLSTGGDGSDGPLGTIAAGFAQILTVAKSFGLDPARFAAAPSRSSAPAPAPAAPSASTKPSK